MDTNTLYDFVKRSCPIVVTKVFFFFIPITVLYNRIDLKLFLISLSCAMHDHEYSSLIVNTMCVSFSKISRSHEARSSLLISRPGDAYYVFAEKTKFGFYHANWNKLAV